MGLGVAVMVARSMVQRLVVGDRSPVKMVAPSREMSTVVGWKVAVHPWSQSRPMESREPEVRVGNMWATQAAGGRWGKSKVAVWVD
jgi:hypothetical protein